MLLMNHTSSRRKAHLLALLVASGTVLASVPMTAMAHPLLPGAALLVVGQAGATDAEAALKSGDYKKAVSLYSDLIKGAPNQYKYYAQRGLAYFNLGEYDKAVADYTEFINRRPNLVDGYQNRAYAYEKLRQADAGLQDLAKVESLDASKIDNELRGRLYLQKKDYPNAIKSFSALPGAVGSLYVGDVYAAQGNTAGAVAAYTKGIAADPKNSYGYFSRGILYIDTKQYALAAKDLTQYTTLKPDDKYGYYQLGRANNALTTAAGYNAAKANFTKYVSLEKDPDQVIDGYRQLAFAQKNTEDFTGAVTNYSKVLSANGKDVSSLYNRGVSYLALKDYPNAIKDLSRYVNDFSSSPDAGNAAYNLGAAYVATNDYGKAADAYGAAIKANPKDAEAYYNRMSANLKLNEYEKVIPDAEAVIANGEPKSDMVADAYAKEADAYNGLAKAKNDKTLGLKALAAMKKYVALKPADATGQQFYRDLVTQYSDSSSQIVEYTAALKTPPADPKALSLIYYNRGVAYSATKQYDLAIQDFTKSSTLTPSDKEVYIDLGDAQVAKKNMPGAIAAYSKAIPLNPDKPELLGTRADLYIETQDYAKADADLAAYMAKSGDKVDPAYIMIAAQLRRKLGKPDEAIALYNKHLEMEKDPANRVTSTTQLGSLYEGKKDFAGAIKTYSDYLNKDSKNVTVLIARARAYRFSNDTDKALSDADNAVGLAPNNPEVLTERAFIRVKEGDKAGDTDPDKAAAAWDAAIADCDKAIAANPKYTLAYYCKGFAAYKNSSDKGKADKAYLTKAIDAFTKFVAVAAPTDPQLPSVKAALAQLKGG